MERMPLNNRPAYNTDNTTSANEQKKLVAILEISLFFPPYNVLHLCVRSNRVVI